MSNSRCIRQRHRNQSGSGYSTLFCRFLRAAFLQLHPGEAECPNEQSEIQRLRSEFPYLLSLMIHSCGGAAIGSHSRHKAEWSESEVGFPANDRPAELVTYSA